LITESVLPFWIAVGPDGRIWLTDVSDGSLRRYSATGVLEASFDGVGLGGFGPGPLAIGPGGEPYVSSGTEIWKLVNGEFQRVIASPVVIWAFAFDVKGNIYAPAPTAGRIDVFDQSGTLLSDPFAAGPDAPQAVAFGRDPDGAMTARVFATETRIGQLIEVNPDGVAHPGHAVGFPPPPFSVEVAAAGLLGAGGLSDADLDHLDRQGNRNGRYDVGDFQAYLRAAGVLPGMAASPQRAKGDR
jgi:hypothetical protein